MGDIVIDAGIPKAMMPLM